MNLDWCAMTGIRFETVVGLARLSANDLNDVSITLKQPDVGQTSIGRVCLGKAGTVGENSTSYPKFNPKFYPT